MFFLNTNCTNRTNLDYVFDFVLLWEPKGSVVATDANVPRRRYALAAIRMSTSVACTEPVSSRVIC